MHRPRRKNSGWPSPRAGTLDLTCPAPTAIPGYFFTLTLTGAWEDLPSPHPHHNPAEAAADHALTTARDITADYLPLDVVPATARINTLLGRPTDLPHLPVRLAWGHVHLTAESDAIHAAQTHQRRQHEREQRRLEHDRRLDEARILRDTLMSDPSLALSYWFATAPHSIDTDTLPRLEALLNTAAAYAPQGQWAPLARLLHTFAERLTDESKNHLIDTLATLTDRYGQPDITTDIQAMRTATEAGTDPQDRGQPDRA
ncbi:hypothetical protein [Streptomyces sp. WAC04114]|uniref:hypothetical protein n=1 Tax=Streptomyces sp. WAC04114 TaxID=2867961 RepID=UPI001C8B0BEF|nr:hypothetical protein [Streptomyces sp. WAC04114]MBX9363638.1 hypothetical protein [Streptomyces sp. WAC04114]